MGKRWSGVLLLAAVACTGDGDGGEGSEAFCDAYLAAAELGIDTDEGIEAMRTAADLAPGDVRVVLDSMAELGEQSSQIPEDQDVTGDEESMEVIVRMQSEDFRAASRRLEEVVTEDCGVERTPASLTPFTGVIGD